MKHATWHKCGGEAHSNPAGYDHCMVCLPYWGSYPLCPHCGKSPRHSQTGSKAKCRGCGKWYTIDRADDPHR